MNILTVIGNLGKDNEMKTLPSGDTVLNNSIGVRSRTKVNGEYETNWFNISIFGKGAQAFSQYTHKGSKVFLSGELKLRTYQKNDGSTGLSADLRVDNFSFLDSANQNEQQGQNNFSQQNGFNQQGGFNQPQNQNNSPFNGQQVQGNGFGGNHQQDGLQGGFGNVNGTMQFDESDMPF